MIALTTVCLAASASINRYPILRRVSALIQEGKNRSRMETAFRPYRTIAERSGLNRPIADHTPNWARFTLHVGTCAEPRRNTSGLYA